MKKLQNYKSKFSNYVDKIFGEADSDEFYESLKQLKELNTLKNKVVTLDNNQDMALNSNENALTKHKPPTKIDMTTYKKIQEKAPVKVIEKRKPPTTSTKPKQTAPIVNSSNNVNKNSANTIFVLKAENDKNGNIKENSQTKNGKVKNQIKVKENDIDTELEHASSVDPSDSQIDDYNIEKDDDDDATVRTDIKSLRSRSVSIAPTLTNNRESTKKSINVVSEATSPNVQTCMKSTTISKNTMHSYEKPSNTYKGKSDRNSSMTMKNNMSENDVGIPLGFCAQSGNSHCKKMGSVTNDSNFQYQEHKGCSGQNGRNNNNVQQYHQLAQNNQGQQFDQMSNNYNGMGENNNMQQFDQMNQYYSLQQMQQLQQQMQQNNTTHIQQMPQKSPQLNDHNRVKGGVNIMNTGRRQVQQFPRKLQDHMQYPQTQQAPHMQQYLQSNMQNYQHIQQAQNMPMSSSNTPFGFNPIMANFPHFGYQKALTVDVGCQYDISEQNLAEIRDELNNLKKLLNSTTLQHQQQMHMQQQYQSLQQQQQAYTQQQQQIHDSNGNSNVKAKTYVKSTSPTFKEESASPVYNGLPGNFVTCMIPVVPSGIPQSCHCSSSQTNNCNNNEQQKKIFIRRPQRDVRNKQTKQRKPICVYEVDTTSYEEELSYQPNIEKCMLEQSFAENRNINNNNNNNSFKCCQAILNFVEECEQYSKCFCNPNMSSSKYKDEDLKKCLNILGKIIIY